MAIPEGMIKQTPAPTPPEANPMSVAAQTAIDYLLAYEPLPPTVHIGALIRTAFDGQRLPRSEFFDFCDQVGQDPRLRYLGKGEYAVASEVTVVPVDERAEQKRPSLEAMIRSWKNEAPRARKKPYSRKAPHFKHGVVMGD